MYMNELRRLQVRESGTFVDGRRRLRNLNLTQAHGHGNAVRANDLRQISLRCGMRQLRETIAEVESDLFAVPRPSDHIGWHARRFDGVWSESRSAQARRVAGLARKVPFPDLTGLTS
jgi:hypothetical protein